MNDELIMIRWHVDRTTDVPVYELICTNDDPELKENLKVSISSEDATERVARAKLIEKMFGLAREKGIDGTRLRFQVNGIDE